MFAERTIAIAHTYWATEFGCSPADLFAEPFRIVIHGGELTGYAGAFALFRGDTAIASLPPDRAADLRDRLLAHSPTHSPGSFALALQAAAAAVIGPAFIGYAAAVTPPAHPARALGPGDAEAVPSLRQACDVAEWEHGGSVSDQPCSGVFLRENLVALAGYEIWGGAIAHISIVTHPGFRGHGYGRSAVAHLAERALAAGLLPQYRTLESNHASIRIAESLGFAHYASSMAVRI